VRDLLRGLLIASGNDAAMALAVGVAGNERAFVRMMNRRARQLGLEHTHYGNPIGLDAPGAHSSARDLVKLALFLRTKPFFRRTVKQASVTLSTGAVPRTLRNRNTLIPAVPWVNGVKTGHTQQAAEVLVGSGRKRGIQVISAVLDEPDKTTRNADTVRLLSFGISQFQRITAARPGTSVGVKVPIRYRRGAELELVVGPNGERTVVPRGRRNTVTIRPIRYPSRVQGPIPYGTRLGMAEVVQDGHRIATVPLIGNAEVPDAGLAQRTKSWFTKPLGVVLAFAVLSATVLLARRRRRPRGPRQRRAREEARAA
jgi:D-alanyl-D-alanine carboxypeptidase (penicillin-binding protein 5/6)